ncbi:hypothetical protein ACS86_18000 [Vibrio alginolyticus]|nr:hypothetical protein ACS86_18000 [Vibrio alginolyticus]
MKILGNLLIVLCIYSSGAYAEKFYTDIVGYEKLSEESQLKFRNFDEKVGSCLSETKYENPYPFSQWLMGLSGREQGRVLFYLSKLAMFNCSENERNELEEILIEENEISFLDMMNKEGFLSKPSHDLDLGDRDKKHLERLEVINYRPFSVIDAVEFFREIKN